MKFCYYLRAKLLLIILLLYSLTVSPAFSEENDSASASDTIEKCRETLSTATAPEEIALAHYKIGCALELLGRNTEATAEYLKIIINYPEVQDVNRKAEERLADLYSGFTDKSESLISKYDESLGQQDPAIFFAYIKSLYENYRNLGQYDKAMQVLRKLYDIDPRNQSYLIDMGNIYLHGYNDADKAIFHFKKLLEMDPKHPSVYVDLGMAYEKKGDYENAIKAYQKAMEVSPVSQWAMYGLRRMEGIALARNKKLVKNWYFLGPFDNSDRDGLDRHFPPEEKTDIKAAYKDKDDNEIAWFKPFDYNDSGLVDLNKLFETNDYTIAYALTYVYSPNEREVQFRFGSDDGIKVWLNDEMVFSYEVERSAEVDDDILTVALRKGWNKILIKVSETWGSWGFFFRVTGQNGKPVEDIIFDPNKDTKRLREVYGKMKKERRLKITRVALVYTGAVSIFFLGLYFMISNIYGRIKTNRMKEDFISGVSHELKTPIAAIKMLAETLKRGKIKQAVRIEEYYDMIIRESDRLTKFINKILDFSRIEKGGEIFYFEKTNAVELAKTAVHIYEDEAQDEELKIELKYDKENIFVELDKDAMLQVLLNLIDNAYKYSKEQKEIKVNVREDGKMAFMEITDKGPGISREEVEKIFDRFYRINKDIESGTKGSGLGLAFVKTIVSAHHGKTAVESEIGKGSKFIIALPLKKI